jgi:hypothetical protein
VLQNGTTTAHGRTWPMFERPAFTVDVVGSIDRDSVESAETLAIELRAVLDRYGVEVKVTPVIVLFMRPEDQAEKDALDEASIS